MKYIVLLRGVNVSGSNIIKMADLKQILEGKGFDQVHTYIQSGNLIVESKKSTKSVSQEISAIIENEFKLNVPAFTYTRGDFITILNNNPYNEADIKKQYFSFISSSPEQSRISELKMIDYPNEEYTITDKVIYFYPHEGYGKAKLNNNLFEKKLGVVATARNLNTVKKLVDLSQ